MLTMKRMKTEEILQQSYNKIKLYPFPKLFSNTIIHFFGCDIVRRYSMNLYVRKPNSTFDQLIWWLLIRSLLFEVGFCLSHVLSAWRAFLTLFSNSLSSSRLVFCFPSLKHQWKRIWPNPWSHHPHSSSITGLSQQEWGSGLMLILGTDVDHWAGSCTLWCFQR